MSITQLVETNLDTPDGVPLRIFARHDPFWDS